MNTIYDPASINWFLKPALPTAAHTQGLNQNTSAAHHYQTNPLKIFKIDF